MKELDLFPLIWETLDALTAHYGPVIDHAAEDLGIPISEWYGWLMAARIFEPDPVSAERLHVRSAYTAPRTLEASLDKGRQHGLLELTGPGEYHLTEAGRAGVEHLIQTAWSAMSALQPLPQADLLRLAALLAQVDDACLAAPEPPGKWCLRIERHYDPGPDAPVMPRLDQHLSDLLAYRDDAHLAAWQQHGVSGQAWEAFTLLWRGTARTLDGLCEKLARRGFTRAEYAAALDELAGQGWVVASGDGFAVTEQGAAIREAVEALTDRYFFAPWGGLSEAEVDELSDRLVRLREALLPVAA